MRLTDLITQFVAPKSRPHAAHSSRRSPAKPDESGKSSLAGPLIAWSQVGQPKWTHRRYDQLAEQGFRKNVIAFRCVMQVSTAASAIPWLLYEPLGEELDRHPLLDLLRHPNPLQDGTAFLESVYAYLQIAGNAYIEAVKPDEGDAPVELYALRPDRMKVVPGPAGLPEAYQYTVNGQVTTWTADPITGESNILHIKQFHPLDDWYGMAPLEAAQVSVDQHNAAGHWNQALLNHGARPSGALVYAPKDGAGTLTDEQIHRLREELGSIYQGSRNAGRPLILEGGLDWREMSLSPKDMDWLAGRNVAARDIALAFGVPAQLVGIPDAQTYANMAEARMALYEETVLPLVGRVMSAFEHWLTPMYEEELELDYDPDEVSALAVRRDVQWNKLQATDFLTINEKRHAIGYGPVEGGDVLDTGNNKKPGSSAPNATPATPAPTALVSPYNAPFTTSSSGPKFNPYHDELGRFTFGPHVSDDDSDDDQSEDSGSDNSDENNDTTGSPTANLNLTTTPLPNRSLSGDAQIVDASGQTASAPANNYPTSSITSLDDAHQVIANSNGQHLGKDEQYASLTHALAPQLPPVAQWLPGDKVQGNLDISLGTPIATFNYQDQSGTNGYGSTDHPDGVSGESHTGIYLGQDATGLSLLNQWYQSGGPRISHIPWNAWNGHIGEGGSRYYTIDY